VTTVSVHSAAMLLEEFLFLLYPLYCAGKVIPAAVWLERSQNCSI